jgi:putative CocE/NonD family hydrolase
VGKRVSYFQDWLHHPEPDAYWASMDHRGNAGRMPHTVLLSGGWHDHFLPGMVADYAALREAGRTVRLLIGPWSHGRGMNTRFYLHEAFAVLDHVLRGEGEFAGMPVRLNITGDNQWGEFTDWPPPGYSPTPWYLHAGGGLSPHLPVPASPTRFRYNPSESHAVPRRANRRGQRRAQDNRRLEARADVLVFSSVPLGRELEVIGPVIAQVHIRSSQPSTDVFARLCDVAPNCRSVNLCDGIIRLRPDPSAVEDIRTARIELWPTAHRFLRGHRVRLQISCGAHPRCARNLGTGELLWTAMKSIDQEIFHDPKHASAVLLPTGPAVAPERGLAGSRKIASHRHARTKT